MATMVKEERFEKILAQLREGSIATYSVLANELAVSEDTVRRDIDQLHQNGLLSKVRGGAIARKKNPLAFHDREGFLNDEKQVIALKVQPLLKNGMTVFMDGGTTMCYVADNFSIDLSLRVVTNNMALLPMLKRFPKIEVIVLGGAYDRTIQTNVGAGTCEQVAYYVADMYLMGTCAISVENGITAANKDDGEVKRAMLKAARQTIVLANSEKLESWEHFKVADLEKVDKLITELPSDDAKLDGFRNKGFQII